MGATLPLRTRAGRGVAFLGARAAILRSFGFIRVAILARLLTPTDFGIFGLAVVLYAGLRIFSSFGINQYLIQKENLDLGLVRSAWSYNIIRGAVIGGVIVIIAPFYAGALGSPEVATVLPVVALAAVVASLANPGYTLAERRVDFGPIVVVNILAAFVETALVVALAIFLRSPLALAWGLVISMVSMVVLSFILFDSVGWPRVRVRDYRELFRVGKHLILSSAATFVGKQVDNLFAGAIIGTAALGVYVVSYRLASLPLEVMSTVVTRVAVPTLSRLQSKGKEMGRAFRDLADFQITAMVPIIVVLVVFAEPIVVLIYGEPWAAGAPVLRALLLVMLGSGLYQITEPYVLASGHFKVIARTKLLEMAIFLPCAFMGAWFWGLTGLALGAGAGYLASALIITSHLGELGAPRIRWAQQIGVTVLATIPSVLAGWATQALFAGARYVETLLVLGAFCVTYLLVLVLFRRALAWRFYELAKSILPGRADPSRLLGGSAECES
jgi:O-antigen/teichoic acid export membrane protein